MRISKKRGSASGFDLKLMPWGDGTEVPTSAKSLVVVDTDNNGLHHIRIFDAAGNCKDTDNIQLTAQAEAIATLKQQLQGILSPHELTDAEKAQVIAAATSFVGQTRPSPPNADEVLKGLRNEFVPRLFQLIIAAFVMVLIALVAEICVVFNYTPVRSQYPSNDPNIAELIIGEKSIMTYIIRSNMGMVLGLLAMALGVTMNWVAIEAPFVLRGALGSSAENRWKLLVQSVSPGIVLMIGGIILVVASIYAPMSFRLNTKGGESGNPPAQETGHNVPVAKEPA